MHQASYLLQLFLSLLSARGLAAQAVDPWRGWVTFKQYARIVHEVPDPGISVQLTPDRGSDEVRLVFLRQVVEPDGDWLRPVGGVVCELTFSEADLRVTPFEFWSFDHGTFERFVDGERRSRHPGWPARRRLRRGIAQFQSALAIAPFKWECRFWIGKALQRLGHHGEALTWFGDALRQEPENASVAKEAANAALELNEHEIAVAFLRSATTINPKDPTLHYNLALALLLAGHPQDSLQAVSAAARLEAHAQTGWLMGWIEDVLAGRRPCPRTLAELGRGA